MRNGFYKLWFKGSIEGASIAMLTDGDLIGCDPSHTFVGQYTVNNGRFHAEVVCQRHGMLSIPGEEQLLDEYHLIEDGGATSEVIESTATVPELPGFKLDMQYIWLCEI